MVRDHVAVITPGAFAAVSGKHSPVERVVEKMIPLAAEHLQIRMFGMADGHWPSQGWIGNVPYYRLPGGRLYLDSLLRYLRKWRPDTVDVHNRPLLACQLKSRLPLSRVLLTLHSASYFSPSGHPNTCTLHMLENVDGLIVNSNVVKRELEMRYPTLRTSVWVNPPGVNPEDFLPRWTPAGEGRRENRLAELGWQDRKIVLAVLHRLAPAPSKQMFAAFRAVLNGEPQAILVIGSGSIPGTPPEAEIEQELKDLSAAFGDRVFPMPVSPHAKVADWYSLADCLVVAPDHAAASGVVAIEAMASAVPVIVAGSSADPKPLVDGFNGYLLPETGLEDALADRVLQLLRIDRLRKEMGLAGMELVYSRYRWVDAADRWVNTICACPFEMGERRRVKQGYSPV